MSVHLHQPISPSSPSAQNLVRGKTQNELGHANILLAPFVLIHAYHEKQLCRLRHTMESNEGCRQPGTLTIARGRPYGADIKYSLLDEFVFVLAGSMMYALL